MLTFVGVMILASMVPFVGFATAQSTQTSSTFDSGIDGWTVYGDAQGSTDQPTYSATGGNPGGYVSADDDVSGGTWYWNAPDKFLGDRSGSYDQDLSFDLRQSSTSSQFDNADVILVGNGMELVYDFGDSSSHPGTSWTSYAIELEPAAGWAVETTDGRTPTASEMRSVLSDLDALRIRGEYRDGADTGSLDNVRLDGSASSSGGSGSSDGTDLRSISVGQTRSGEIDTGDPQSTDNRGYYEPVTFSGQAGQTVTIDMVSDGDTYLILRGPNGQEVARDDDSGAMFDSRIENARLPSTGEYTIIATSYSSSATFTYELTLEESGSTGDGTDLRSISVGQTRSGEIDTGDPQSTDNRGYYEPVTFQGSAGQTVTIEMTSSDDTYLILRGPSGQEIARDDDGGDGLDSRIENVQLPSTGQYTIVATSFSSGDTFTYELSLQSGSGGAGGGADLRSISIGQTRSGEIDTSDPSSTDNRGTYEPVTFNGQAGQTVTISMTSGEGDTYLILLGPNGQEIARDDDSGGALNSRIQDAELPDTGQYTIVATSYWDDRHFPYTLSLDSGDDGAAGSAALTIPPVEVSPGGTVTVTYELTNTGSSAEGFVLQSGMENLPSGWSIASRSDGSGSWQSSGQSWLFQNLAPGDTVTPSVTVSAPSGVAAGEEVKFDATALAEGSTTTADVEITVRETTLAQVVDQNDNGRIGDLEILTAIEWWQNDEVVPGYGERISDLDILRLIGLWQDNEQIDG